MKSFRKYALLLTVLLVATGIVYESTGFSNQPPAAGVQSCGFFDSVFQQREQNRISVEQARAEVDQIKKQLEANNNKFVVGITDAMRRRIEELVGTKKPQNLQIQAGKRFSAAEAEMNNFMREMQRAGFKMPDFFYGWSPQPVQPQPQPQPVQPQPAPGPVNPNNQGGGQADNKPSGPVSPTPDSNVVPRTPRGRAKRRMRV